MTRIPKSFLFAALALATLSGCAPHLKKLGVCSGGKYRYANPQGVSLPSLDVPTVDEVGGAQRAASPPPPPAPPPPSVRDKGSPAPAPDPDVQAPVASPPKAGAMLMPVPGSSSFGSC